MKQLFHIRFFFQLGILMVADRSFGAEAILPPAAMVIPKESSSPIYSPTGKRDPFKIPYITTSREPASVAESEHYNLDQYQLRGVLRGDGKTRAMFEDPAGKSFILSEGENLGREHATISRILDSEVIVTMRTINYLGAESIYEKFIALPR